MFELTLLQEFRTGAVRSARLDREARTIRGAILLGAESVNGPHGRRRYTEAALRQVAVMAEGLPAYANHAPPGSVARDVSQLIGRHRNARYDPTQEKVLTDLHVLEYQAPWVFALAEDLGDLVGLSLVSRGRARMQDGVERVEEIVEVRSGDLVSDPATTKGLFEHRERWLAEHALSYHHEGGAMNTTKGTLHMRMDAALGGPRLFSELVEAHRANPPRELHETWETVLPPGTHAKLIEALGGQVVVRVAEGIHGRLSTALVG